MGEIIRIREQTGPDEFRIWFTVTGEERVVTLDPDKQALFRSGRTGSQSLACPFLRRNSDGLFTCTVHHSRPDLCRQYACFRVLVLDSKGLKHGRVVEHTRYFVSADPLLNALWKNTIEPAVISDEDLWEEHVELVLTAAGYRVVR